MHPSAQLLRRAFIQVLMKRKPLLLSNTYKPSEGRTVVATRRDTGGG